LHCFVGLLGQFVADPRWSPEICTRAHLQDSAAFCFGAPAAGPFGCTGTAFGALSTFGGRSFMCPAGHALIRKTLKGVSGKCDKFA